MQTLSSLVKDNATSLQLQIALLELYTKFKDTSNAPLFKTEIDKIESLLHPNLINNVLPPTHPNLVVLKYERRIRPLWVENSKWHTWQTCTFEEYRTLSEMPQQDGRLINGNWEFGVRRLFIDVNENPQ